MPVLVLDAGALIALERDDRRMWARLRVTVSGGGVVLVPSTVIAQTWRARASQALLGRALAHCAIAPFDRVARAVGELCGRAGTADVCDAHVALVAATSGDVLCTSDPEDMGVLLAAHGRRRPVVVPC